MRFKVLLLLAVALSAGPAEARDIVIEADGSGEFPTIQDGILASSPGDVILVGPGAYTWANAAPQTYDYQAESGVRNGADLGMLVFFGGDTRGIAVRSRDGAASTILDAEGMGRHVYADGSSSVRIDVVFEGFTFRNGRAPLNEERNIREGGSVNCHLSYPDFRSCVFENNQADIGGAVWWGNVFDATLVDCSFIGNAADGGGALLLANNATEAVVTGCTFEGNHSTGQAGALWAFNVAASVRDCTFLTNSSDGAGAAIFAQYTKPLLVENAWFEGNQSTTSMITLAWVANTGGENPRPAPADTRLQLRSSVLTDNPSPTFQMSAEAILEPECTNILRSTGAEWNGASASHLGTNGNFSEDPILCEDHPDPYAVRDDSPMLAINNGCATDIGPYTQGCESEIITPPGPGGTLVLKASYPNPFRPDDSTVATLEFVLPSGSSPTLEIFTLTGKRVCRLEAGTDRATWDGRDADGRPVSSGVYVARLTSGDEIAQRRVVVLR